MVEIGSGAQRAKLRREQITMKDKANRAHRGVEAKLRQTIQESIKKPNL